MSKSKKIRNILSVTADKIGTGPNARVRIVIDGDLHAFTGFSNSIAAAGTMKDLLKDFKPGPFGIVPPPAPFRPLGVDAEFDEGPGPADKQ